MRCKADETDERGFFMDEVDLLEGLLKIYTPMHGEADAVGISCLANAGTVPLRGSLMDKGKICAGLVLSDN